MWPLLLLPLLIALGIAALIVSIAGGRLGCETSLAWEVPRARAARRPSTAEKYAPLSMVVVDARSARDVDVPNRESVLLPTETSRRALRHLPPRHPRRTIGGPTEDRYRS